MAIVAAQEKLLLAPFGTSTAGSPNKANPTQERVLDWVDRVRAGQHHKGGIPTLLIQGGVGSGKTRGYMAAVSEMALETPGLRIFWGRQDLKDLKLSVIDKLIGEIIPWDIIVDKSEQYNWYEIQQPTGARARIQFNGLKDLSGLGSQEFGVIVVTEAHEITEFAYRTLKRRCRQEKVPVMILMESEPPNEGHWMNEVINEGSPEFDPDIEKWELSTYENWENLPLAYRQSLETMPEAWKRKYLHGKTGFIPNGKPFYQGFNEALHVIDAKFNENDELICGWDFGYIHPAVCFNVIDRNGRLIVLKEMIGNNLTINAFAEQVISVLNRDFKNPSRIIHYGDPAVTQVNDKSEKTSWQILKDLGIKIHYRKSDYRLRKEIIEKRLSTLQNGKPLIVLDKKCRTMIDGFLGGYHYRQLSNDEEIKSNYEIPVHNYYSHIMNAFEYVCVNVFKPIDREKTNKYGNILRSTLEMVNGGIGYARR